MSHLRPISVDPAAVSAPSANANSGNVDRATGVFCIVLFVAALGTHFYLATKNFTWGFMIGHEFRQSQTALNTFFINQDNNFSPFYETPLFGKPWVIPLEFPFYEWCVVWLSRATHWPDFMAARAISLGSFYASLPALFILLGRVGLSRWRRLVVLSLLLATPTYIFYSRTFLIDPMTFMLSAWFLALFVETLERRKWSLLLVCAFCGTLAGLIKSLVFMAWVFPAAAFGAWKLWRCWRAKAGGLELRRILFWGIGPMVLPTLAMVWWVKATDVLKENHPSAYIFTSKNLSADNYGSFSLASRLAKNTWRSFLICWDMAIAAPWIIGALLAVGLVLLPRERWRILGAGALFMVPQLAIPYAYAGQDYYYYTCAAFVVVAFGFVANGVLDLSWPRALRWLVVLLPFVGLLDAHRRTYYQWQSVKSHGGSRLANALRDFLPKTSVIIVAGADWSAVIPYYSQHKALMIRNGYEYNAEHLTNTFNSLAGEDVGALVLVGDQRKNFEIVDRAAAAFNIDTKMSFSDGQVDVYLNTFYRADIVGNKLKEGDGYQLTLGPEHIDNPREQQILKPSSGTLAAAFSMVNPGPLEYRSRYGYGTWEVDGVHALNAHPDTDLWVPVPEGATRIEWRFGIRREAYEREGPATNGVSFLVELENDKGVVRRVFGRVLNPRMVEADRGTQTEIIKFQAQPGEKLVFRTRPYGDYAFDWSYWVKIDVN